MPLYLGLDSSTQSLTAIVLDVEGDRREVVFQSSLPFDEALPQYGTRHGVLPHGDPSVAHSSPLMWADALDVMLGRDRASGLDLSRLAAISGSAQQHGSVYLSGVGRLAADPRRCRSVDALARRRADLDGLAARRSSARRSTAAVGGDEVLAAHTGSRAFERFTGPQIRKFFKTAPDRVRRDRTHSPGQLVSRVAARRHARAGRSRRRLGHEPDGSDERARGGRRRSTRRRRVSRAKLPPIVPRPTIVGTLSPYWQRRHGLPAARVVAWSGDNPCSLIGTGLVREGVVAISLGTSDTIFGLMREPRVAATAPVTCSVRRPAISWASRCSATARSRASGCAMTSA